MKVEDAAACQGGKGPVIQRDGKGWRGGGVNWKG